MAATSTPPTQRHYAIRGSNAPSAQPSGPGTSIADDSRFLSRWLKVWIALLAVIVLVVVVYLIAITNSLASINGNLAVADRSVTGAGGDTKSLPDQVAGINASLEGIDPALKPIPGQADQIIAALSTIDGSLADTDASLVVTSGSLQDTSSQLVSTSGVLQTVLGQAGEIRNVLAQADRPNGDCGSDSCGGDQVGVQNIHQRVAIANNVLVPAEVDTTNIVAGLDAVNASLSSICSKTGSLRSGAGSCPR
ncbi:hypothetical protein BH18ACT4_BH18ACT4_14420 [soil metagenome]